MPKLPKLPELIPERAKRATRSAAPAKPRADGVVFAVYAPFGTDETLSRYPNPAAPIAPVHKQLLVQALQKVAAQGVNVSLLIDIFDDDSYLVEIPAGKPQSMVVSSAWKQDMSDRHALTGFLRRVHQRFPCDALVLAIEGHGGGFVPDIDPARITPASVTNWQDGNTPRTARWVRTSGLSQPLDDTDPNSPPLPMPSPELPMPSPELPAARMPMSTWAYGEALGAAIKAGVPRPAVIHFNNCFNASVELLHTVAPHAEYATGYANYDFFTAGVAYPRVFNRLRQAGSATAEQLAQWFAIDNGGILQQKGNHPIIGATVKLKRMRTTVSAALDCFAVALTQGLRSANGDAVRLGIRKAAIAAQHYDTEPGYQLKVPDQFIDLAGFAIAIKDQFPGDPIHGAAAALETALGGLWQFGDRDWPWMGHDQNLIYDFRDKRLGLNIFFPDPALDGIWDWRSPYYLSGKVDPKKPPAHRHVIDFLADQGSQRPRWVEFIVEYHRTTRFIGFYPARPLFFPIFDTRFNPKDDIPPGPNGPGGPTNPDGPGTTGTTGTPGTTGGPKKG